MKRVAVAQSISVFVCCLLLLLVLCLFVCLLLLFVFCLMVFKISVLFTRVRVEHQFVWLAPPAINILLYLCSTRILVSGKHTRALYRSGAAAYVRLPTRTGSKKSFMSCEEHAKYLLFQLVLLAFWQIITQFLKRLTTRERERESWLIISLLSLSTHTLNPNTERRLCATLAKFPSKQKINNII